VDPTSCKSCSCRGWTRPHNISFRCEPGFFIWFSRRCTYEGLFG